MAYLAGLQIGLYRDLAEIAEHWQRERAFEPAMPEAKRNELYEGWLDAIRRVRD